MGTTITAATQSTANRCIIHATGRPRALTSSSS